MGGLRRKGSAVANWMKGAVKPGRRGVFKRKAAAAGMSTSAFAAKEAGAPGRLGKEARLAQTFARLRPRTRKTSGGLAENLTAMRAKGAFGK
jgi:hypothetical protein